MTNSIITGYDGTKPSENAVLWAAAEAELQDVPLRIICCYSVPPPMGAMGIGYGEATMELRAAADLYAKEIAEIVTARYPTLALSTDVYMGPAWSSIAEAATADDIVVVGASSHEGAAAFWLGSTPRRLTRECVCPVVVVRGALGAPPRGRVLVGIDGSESSRTALLWACDEADARDAEVVVLHAWAYPYRPVDTSSQQGEEITEIDAACLLDEELEVARQRCGHRVSGALVRGEAAAVITSAATDVDLVVVGCRGRGALASSVFGSTVNTLLEHCPAPVAVVHPTGDRAKHAGKA